jgi:ATP-dependent Clp protease ATP-binding subunit ClpC
MSGAARGGLGDRPAAGQIELTPRTRDILALAIDEADRLGHLPVVGEHVPLGLAREGKGIAAFVLTTSGVDLEQVRQRALGVLRRSSLDEPAPGAPPGDQAPPAA